MAQRRPIASHPALGPFAAAWFAALFGLGTAVLPPAVLGRVAAGLGLAGTAGRIALIVAAAMLGAILGLAAGRLLRQRADADLVDRYAEDAPFDDDPMPAPPPRRPLNVREELTRELPPQTSDASFSISDDRDQSRVAAHVRSDTSGSPAADLESLLTQFDSALAAFRSERGAATGAGSTMSGLVAGQGEGARGLDHQADLRAMLDKLAAARTQD